MQPNHKFHPEKLRWLLQMLNNHTTSDKKLIFVNRIDINSSLFCSEKGDTYKKQLNQLGYLCPCMKTGQQIIFFNTTSFVINTRLVNKESVP
jgi:hypothetical protein